jgi:hypothetical protein
MGQIADEKHGRQQEAYAEQSRPHYSEEGFGSIPGSVVAVGRYVTVCCGSEPFSVYNHGGVREGTCKACGEFSNLKLLP